ncbi:MAG: hypothetical protein ACOCXG_05960 [Nanoarchaeota archaeon]
MAHTGIFATSDEILVKAGENYDTSITEDRINALCLQAESYINCISRKNWSDAYSGLNADVKGILAEAESCLVAIYIIQFNMAGYTSRVEAEDMLNVLKVRFNECMELLKDQKVVTFMEGA